MALFRELWDATILTTSYSGKSHEPKTKAKT